MMRRNPDDKVMWSEDIRLPICSYCLNGMECTCEALYADECNFCDGGCECGYSQVVDGEVCECECKCGDNADGNCSECCKCKYPIREELPDQCYCECECVQCECECSCPIITIDADSYNAWVRDTCYVCPEECLSDEYLRTPKHITESFLNSSKRCITDLGQYQFLIKTLPHYVMRSSGPTFMGVPMLRGSKSIKQPARLGVIQDGYQSSVQFSGPVHIPVLVKPREYGEPTVWMSLTPMEVFSQRPGLDLAAGKVLIGGLGMGWLTSKILEKPEVTHVTQIELNPFIADFFGKPLLERYSNLDIVVADVWKYLDSCNITDFDTIVLDIWPGYSSARFDEKFKLLKRKALSSRVSAHKYPKVWGWGETPVRNMKD